MQNLVKDVKEEYDADDAVSSSSHVARFINASVQTPNKPRLEVLREFRVSPPLDMSAQTFSRVEQAPREQCDEDQEDTSETAEMY